jgi:hypothetical protein
MTSDAATLPSARTLAVAGRQLAMLGELAELAMVVTRGFAESAVASAKAEGVILSQEWFTPEVGRARACGAKDSAESFQKASRAVRLTLMLEKATAEWLDDLESGAPREAVVETAAVSPAAVFQPRREASRDRDQATDEVVARRESDREPVEFDRPDRFPSASLRETVDAIGADLSAAVDWDTWQVRWPEFTAAAIRAEASVNSGDIPPRPPPPPGPGG